MDELQPDPRISFVDLLTLEPLETDSSQARCNPQFMGKHTAPSLGGGAGFGGHVYAQSVWAAAQTVGEGMVVHNVHGYFTLPVHTDRPLFYDVQTLSLGRSYCTRFVTVRQPLEPLPFPFQSVRARGNLGNVCFASMCSFKKDEPSRTKHQIKADLKGRYGSLIEDDPSKHSIAPKIDSPWWCSFMRANPHFLTDDFPGLDIRKVDMECYNDSKPPEEWRQLTYYRPIGVLSLTSPNLHACAHLYASDRNSLFLVSNAVGFGDEVNTMGSLSHSVIFHVGSQDLLMNEEEWWCQEAWTPRSEGGRGMHESRIWDERGVLVASTWQDGLVRKAEEGRALGQRSLWLEGMLRKGEIGEDVARSLRRNKL